MFLFYFVLHLILKYFVKESNRSDAFLGSSACRIISMTTADPKQFINLKKIANVRITLTSRDLLVFKLVEFDQLGEEAEFKLQQEIQQHDLRLSEIL